MVRGTGSSNQQGWKWWIKPISLQQQTCLMMVPSVAIICIQLTAWWWLTMVHAGQYSFANASINAYGHRLSGHVLVVVKQPRLVDDHRFQTSKTSQALHELLWTVPLSPNWESVLKITSQTLAITDDFQPLISINVRHYQATSNHTLFVYHVY